MTRKQFLKAAVEVTAATLGLTMLHACTGASPGPDGSGPPQAGHCLADGTTVAIAQNHGHVLVVTIADIQAGTDRTYDIRGHATHTHSVTITAAQFAQLAADHGIMTVSTTNAGHSHEILVMCA